MNAQQGSEPRQQASLPKSRLPGSNLPEAGFWPAFRRERLGSSFRLFAGVTCHCRSFERIVRRYLRIDLTNSPASDIRGCISDLGARARKQLTFTISCCPSSEAISVYYGEGASQGQSENSPMIELDNIPRRLAEEAAILIKEMNCQQAVLLQETPVMSQFL